MPCYPEIATPCPVADRLDDVIDGDFCRRCSKTVSDLDAVNDAARYRLLADAPDGLCVRYRMPNRAALAAAALFAAFPTAAQQTAPAATAAAAPDPAYDEIVVGGARRLSRAERAEMRREARREERREAVERRRTEKVMRKEAR